MWCWHKWEIYKSDSYAQIKANVRTKIEYENRYQKLNNDDTPREDCPTELISGSYIPPPPIPPTLRVVSESVSPKKYEMKTCFKCGSVVDTYSLATVKAHQEIAQQQMVKKNVKRVFDNSLGENHE